MSFKINEDNQNKSVSGINTKTLIAEMLEEVQNIPQVNITVSENAKIGYPNQVPMFYMDQEVTFNDIESEKWLIKTTNSVRSDRVMGNEWFAQNIRIIDSTVKRIYLTVPDSIDEKELKSAKNYSKRTQDPEVTSFLTDVNTVYELKWLIIEYALQNTSVHVRSNILGALAELDTIKALNNEKNLLLWNDFSYNKTFNKTQSFRRFRMIMEKIGLRMKKDQLTCVEASKCALKLENGGNPKTDVSFIVSTDNDRYKHNITIKNTNKKEVTIHEGKMIDIINALEIDIELAEALILFEKFGSVRELKKNKPKALELIENKLPTYNKELIKFFFFGEKGPHVIDAEQISDMILYNQKFEVKLSDDFVGYYLDTYKHKGQMNTPFKWTYPSGNKGKKIQIKGFTNN